MADPKQTEKYNLIQKKLGGYPLDTGNSLRVNEYLKTIVNLIREKGKETDYAYIQSVVPYLLRRDGTCSDLTDEERQRTIDILLEFFRP